MREVIYKNLSSKASNKREVFIQETISENGCVSKTVKRSLYFIRIVRSVDTKDELDLWLKDKESGCNQNDKNFHIMKVHSDDKRSDIVLCKAKGNFYIIVGKDIYDITYFHCLRMEISGPKLEKVN